MMESNITFFPRLHSLCRHIDTQMASLKQELSRPPGQTPHTYDRGLGRIKDDIQELKKQSQEMKESLASFSNFSSYLRSIQDLVNQQATDTDKMEQYCAKYGYVAPPRPTADSTPPVTEEKSPKNGVREEPGESCWEATAAAAAPTPISSQVTPELSLQGQMLLQGKDVPLITQKPKACTVSTSVNFPETPVTSKICLVQGAESSVSQPYLSVEQWLAGVEGSALTPDVIKTVKPQRKENLVAMNQVKTVNSKQSHTQLLLQAPLAGEQKPERLLPLVSKSSQMVTAQEKSSLPAEPELSKCGTQLIAKYTKMKSEKNSSICGKGLDEVVEPEIAYQVPQVNTPEEPVLHYQENRPACLKSPVADKGTPEEPVLFYQNNYPSGVNYKGTPEEPVLFYQNPITSRQGPGVIRGIPAEPVLFHQHKEQLAGHGDLIVQEEPTLGTAHTRPKDSVPSRLKTPCKNNSEVPRTPELSDVTMSLLSLTSRLGPPPPSKDLFSTNITSQVPQRTGQSFSSALSQLSRPMDENTWESRQVQQKTNPPINQRSKALWDSYQTQIGQFHNDYEIPPSPQLSDMTQKIIGQMKR